MQGAHYWFTGIIVTFSYEADSRWGWSAALRFFDAGFNSGYSTRHTTISTEGTMHTRYAISDPDQDLTAALHRAVTALLEDATKLGLRLNLLAYQEITDLDNLTFLYDDGRGWGDDWDHDAPISQKAARRIVAEVNTRVLDEVIRTGKILVRTGHGDHLANPVQGS